jgi:uncharacterized protein YjiS (DUF1127 family)
MTSLTMTAGKTSLLARVAQFFVDLNEKRIQRRNVNYTIKQLSALTDRELWDMGITRGDIWSVAHGTADVEELRRGMK